MFSIFILLFLRFSGCFRFFIQYPGWTSTTSRDSLSYLNLFLSFG